MTGSGTPRRAPCWPGQAAPLIRNPERSCTYCCRFYRSGKLRPPPDPPRASTMLVTDHHTLEHLQGLAQAIPQKRHWRRVHAVVLAKQGRTAGDIAQALGCSLRAVKNWVAQYNRGGIAALDERPRAGRPRLLTPEHYPRASAH